MNFNNYCLEHFNLLIISFCLYSFQFFYLTIQLSFNNFLAFVIHKKVFCFTFCITLLKILHNNAIIKKKVLPPHTFGVMVTPQV